VFHNIVHYNIGCNIQCLSHSQPKIVENWLGYSRALPSILDEEESFDESLDKGFSVSNPARINLRVDRAASPFISSNYICCTGAAQTDGIVIAPGGGGTIVNNSIVGCKVAVLVTLVDDDTDSKIRIRGNSVSFNFVGCSVQSKHDNTTSTQEAARAADASARHGMDIEHNYFLYNVQCGLYLHNHSRRINVFSNTIACNNLLANDIPGHVASEICTLSACKRNSIKRASDSIELGADMIDATGGVILHKSSAWLMHNYIFANGSFEAPHTRLVANVVSMNSNCVVSQNIFYAFSGRAFQLSPQKGARGTQIDGHLRIADILQTEYTASSPPSLATADASIQRVKARVNSSNACWQIVVRCRSREPISTLTASEISNSPFWGPLAQNKLMQNWWTRPVPAILFHSSITQAETKAPCRQEVAANDMSLQYLRTVSKSPLSSDMLDFLRAKTEVTHPCSSVAVLGPKTQVWYYSEEETPPPRSIDAALAQFQLGTIKDFNFDTGKYHIESANDEVIVDKSNVWLFGTSCVLKNRVHNGFLFVSPTREPQGVFGFSGACDCLIAGNSITMELLDGSNLDEEASISTIRCASTGCLEVCRNILQGSRSVTGIAVAPATNGLANVEQNRVVGFSRAISVDSTTKAVVHHNVISKGSVGIFVEGNPTCVGAMMVAFNIFDGNDTGVMISDSKSRPLYVVHNIFRGHEADSSVGVLCCSVGCFINSNVYVGLEIGIRVALAQLSDEQFPVVVHKNLISGCNERGVLFEAECVVDRSLVTFESNCICHTNGIGFLARARAAGTITRNKFTKNAGGGLLCDGASSLTITCNAFVRNRNFGVDLRSFSNHESGKAAASKVSGQLLLRSNVISSNHGCGLRLGSKCSAMIVDNIVSRTMGIEGSSALSGSGCGMLVSQMSTPTVIANIFAENCGHGVVVSECGHGTTPAIVERNLVRDNHLTGIFIEYPCGALVRHNNVLSNRGVSQIYVVGANKSDTPKSATLSKMLEVYGNRVSASFGAETKQPHPCIAVVDADVSDNIKVTSNDVRGAIGIALRNSVVTVAGNFLKIDKLGFLIDGGTRVVRISSNSVMGRSRLSLHPSQDLAQDIAHLLVSDRGAGIPVCQSVSCDQTASPLTWDPQTEKSGQSKTFLDDCATRVKSCTFVVTSENADSEGIELALELNLGWDRQTTNSALTHCIMAHDKVLTLLQDYCDHNPNLSLETCVSRLVLAMNPVRIACTASQTLTTELNCRGDICFSQSSSTRVETSTPDSPGDIFANRVSIHFKRHSVHIRAHFCVELRRNSSKRDTGWSMSDDDTLVSVLCSGSHDCVTADQPLRILSYGVPDWSRPVFDVGLVKHELRTTASDVDVLQGPSLQLSFDYCVEAWREGGTRVEGALGFASMSNFASDDDSIATWCRDEASKLLQSHFSLRNNPKAPSVATTKHNFLFMGTAFDFSEHDSSSSAECSVEANVMRNLSVAVRMTACTTLLVVRNSICNTDAGIICSEAIDNYLVEGNSFLNCCFAILLKNAGSVLVQNNAITDCTCVGIYGFGSTKVTAVQNSLSNCVKSVFVNDSSTQSIWEQNIFNFDREQASVFDSKAVVAQWNECLKQRLPTHIINALKDTVEALQLSDASDTWTSVDHSGQVFLLRDNSKFSGNTFHVPFVAHNSSPVCDENTFCALPTFPVCAVLSGELSRPTFRSNVFNSRAVVGVLIQDACTVTFQKDLFQNVGIGIAARDSSCVKVQATTVQDALRCGILCDSSASLVCEGGAAFERCGCGVASCRTAGSIHVSTTEFCENTVGIVAGIQGTQKSVVAVCQFVDNDVGVACVGAASSDDHSGIIVENCSFSVPHGLHPQRRSDLINPRSKWQSVGALVSASPCSVHDCTFKVAVSDLQKGTEPVSESFSVAVVVGNECKPECSIFKDNVVAGFREGFRVEAACILDTNSVTDCRMPTTELSPSGVASSKFGAGIVVSGALNGQLVLKNNDIRRNSIGAYFQSVSSATGRTIVASNCIESNVCAGIVSENSALSMTNNTIASHVPRSDGDVCYAVAVFGSNSDVEIGEPELVALASVADYKSLKKAKNRIEKNAIGIFAAAEAIVCLRGNDIVDNHTGVSSVGHCKLTIQRNNIHLTESVLPHSRFVGVSVNNAQGIMEGNHLSNFDSATGQNVDVERSFGIRLGGKDCDMTLSDNTFQKCFIGLIVGEFAHPTCDQNKFVHSRFSEIVIDSGGCGEYCSNQLQCSSSSEQGVLITGEQTTPQFGKEGYRNTISGGNHAIKVTGKASGSISFNDLMAASSAVVVSDGATADVFENYFSPQNPAPAQSSTAQTGVFICDTAATTSKIHDNKFAKLRNGIKVENSCTIEENKFSDMIGPSIAGSLPGKVTIGPSNAFLQCSDVCIGLSGGVVEVIDNQFVRCDRTIHLSSCQKIAILENEFVAANVALHIDGGADLPGDNPNPLQADASESCSIVKKNSFQGFSLAIMVRGVSDQLVVDTNTFRSSKEGACAISVGPSSGTKTVTTNKFDVDAGHAILLQEGSQNVDLQRNFISGGRTGVVADANVAFQMRNNKFDGVDCATLVHGSCSCTISGNFFSHNRVGALFSGSPTDKNQVDFVENTLEDSPTHVTAAAMPHLRQNVFTACSDVSGDGVLLNYCGGGGRASDNKFHDTALSQWRAITITSIDLHAAVTISKPPGCGSFDSPAPELSLHACPEVDNNVSFGFCIAIFIAGATAYVHHNELTSKSDRLERSLVGPIPGAGIVGRVADSVGIGVKSGDTLRNNVRIEENRIRFKACGVQVQNSKVVLNNNGFVDNLVGIDISQQHCDMTAQNNKISQTSLSMDGWVDLTTVSSKSIGIAVRGGKHFQVDPSNSVQRCDIGFLFDKHKSASFAGHVLSNNHCCVLISRFSQIDVRECEFSRPKSSGTEPSASTSSQNSGDDSTIGSTFTPEDVVNQDLAVASLQGIGLYVSDSTCTIDSNTFQSNSQKMCSGLVVTGADSHVAVTNNKFSQNFFDFMAAQVQDISVMGNSFCAGIAAGAVFVSGAGGTFVGNEVRNYHHPAVAGVLVHGRETCPMIGSSVQVNLAELLGKIWEGVRSDFDKRERPSINGDFEAFTSTSRFEGNAVGIMVSHNAKPTVQGVEFLDNVVGIECQTLIADGVKMSSNLFTKRSTDKQSTGIRFRRCYLSSLCVRENFFEDVDVGIHAVFSRISLELNLFRECKIGTLCCGRDANNTSITALHKNLYHNCKTAIKGQALPSTNVATEGTAVQSATALLRVQQNIVSGCEIGIHVSAVSCMSENNMILFAKDSGVYVEGAAFQLSQFVETDVGFCKIGMHFHRRTSSVSHVEVGNLIGNDVGLHIQECDSRVIVERLNLSRNRVGVQLCKCTENFCVSTQNVGNRSGPSKIDLPSTSSLTRGSNLYYNNEGPHLLALNFQGNIIGLSANNSRVQLSGCVVQGGSLTADTSAQIVDDIGILALSSSCVRVYGGTTQRVFDDMSCCRRSRDEYDTYVHSSQFQRCKISNCSLGVKACKGAFVYVQNCSVFDNSLGLHSCEGAHIIMESSVVRNNQVGTSVLGDRTQLTAMHTHFVENTHLALLFDDGGSGQVGSSAICDNGSNITAEVCVLGSSSPQFIACLFGKINPPETIESASSVPVTVFVHGVSTKCVLDSNDFQGRGVAVLVSPLANVKVVRNMFGSPDKVDASTTTMLAAGIIVSEISHSMLETLVGTHRPTTDHGDPALASSPCISIGNDSEEADEQRPGGNTFMSCAVGSVLMGTVESKLPSKTTYRVYDNKFQGDSIAMWASNLASTSTLVHRNSFDGMSFSVACVAKVIILRQTSTAASIADIFPQPHSFEACHVWSTSGVDMLPYSNGVSSQLKAAVIQILLRPLVVVSNIKERSDSDGHTAVWGLLIAPGRFYGAAEQPNLFLWINLSASSLSCAFAPTFDWHHLAEPRLSPESTERDSFVISGNEFFGEGSCGVLSGSSCAITGNRFSEQSVGITVAGRTEVSVEDNEFTDSNDATQSKCVGILWLEGSGSFVGNVVQNQMFGALLRGTASSVASLSKNSLLKCNVGVGVMNCAQRIAVRDNIFDGCSTGIHAVGVKVTDRLAVVGKNAIRDCAFAIDIADEASPLLDGFVVANNEVGLRFSHCGGVLRSGVVLRNNVGVVIEDASPTLSCEHKGQGDALVQDETVEIKDISGIQIVENRDCGVSISGHLSHPALARLSFRANCCGLRVTQRSRPTLEHCAFHTSTNNSIIVCDAAPEFTECEIVDNASDSFAVRVESGCPKFRSCYFGRNTGGICLESGDKVDIIASKFESNATALLVQSKTQRVDVGALIEDHAADETQQTEKDHERTGKVGYTNPETLQSFVAFAHAPAQNRRILFENNECAILIDAAVAVSIQGCDFQRNSVCVTRSSSHGTTNIVANTFVGGETALKFSNLAALKACNNLFVGQSRCAVLLGATSDSDTPVVEKPTSPTPALQSETSEGVGDGHIISNNCFFNIEGVSCILNKAVCSVTNNSFIQNSAAVTMLNCPEQSMVSFNSFERNGVAIIVSQNSSGSVASNIFQKNAIGIILCQGASTVCQLNHFDARHKTSIIVVGARSGVVLRRNFLNVATNCVGVVCSDKCAVTVSHNIFTLPSNSTALSLGASSIVHDNIVAQDKGSVGNIGIFDRDTSDNSVFRNVFCVNHRSGRPAEIGPLPKSAIASSDTAEAAPSAHFHDSDVTARRIAEVSARFAALCAAQEPITAALAAKSKTGFFNGSNIPTTLPQVAEKIATTFAPFFEMSLTTDMSLFDMTLNTDAETSCEVQSSPVEFHNILTAVNQSTDFLRNFITDVSLGSGVLDELDLQDHGQVSVCLACANAKRGKVQQNHFQWHSTPAEHPCFGCVVQNCSTELVDNTFTRSFVGLLVNGIQSTGSFKSNTFDSNHYGIISEQRSPCSVLKNTIRRAVVYGLLVQKKSTASCVGNTVEFCGKANVAVALPVGASIDSNMIGRSESGYGLYIKHSTKVKGRSEKPEREQSSSPSVGSPIELQGQQLDDNQMPDDYRLLVKNNILEDNAVGMLIHGPVESKHEIANNQVCGSTRVGIRVSGGANATIGIEGGFPNCGAGNLISDSHGVGMEIWGYQTNPYIIGNKFERNRGGGLIFQQSSSATVRGNSFEGHRVVADSSSTAFSGTALVLAEPLEGANIVAENRFVQNDNGMIIANQYSPETKTSVDVQVTNNYFVEQHKMGILVERHSSPFICDNAFSFAPTTVDTAQVTGVQVQGAFDS